MQQTAQTQDSPPTAFSQLDESIAQFQREHGKLMAIDSDIQALRAHRKSLQERIQHAQDSREVLCQGRISQLVHGEPDLESSKEYRELGELIEDAQVAIRQSEQQEKRMVLPLYEAQQAVTKSRDALAQGYAQHLDSALLPGIIKPLVSDLAKLAAITRAKAGIMGQDAALAWARAKMADAFNLAMAREPVLLEDNPSAVHDVLATSTTPRSLDLLALCDSPGKLHRLRQEMNT